MNRNKVFYIKFLDLFPMNCKFDKIIPSTNNGFLNKMFSNYFFKFSIEKSSLNNDYFSKNKYQKTKFFFENFLNQIFGLMMNPGLSVLEKYNIAKDIKTNLNEKTLSKRNLYKFSTIMESFLLGRNNIGINAWKEILKQTSLFLRKVDFLRYLRKDLNSKNEKIQTISVKIFFLLNFSRGFFRLSSFYRSFSFSIKSFKNSQKLFYHFFGEIIKNNVFLDERNSKFMVLNFLLISKKKNSKFKVKSSSFLFLFLEKLKKKKIFFASFLIPSFFSNLKKKKSRQELFITLCSSLISIFGKKISSTIVKRLFNFTIFLEAKQKANKNTFLTLKICFRGSFFSKNLYQAWFIFFFINFFSKNFFKNFTKKLSHLHIFPFFFKRIGYNKSLNLLKKTLFIGRKNEISINLMAKNLINDNYFKHIPSIFLKQITKLFLEKLKNLVKKKKNRVKFFLFLGKLIKKFPKFHSKFFPTIMGIIKWQVQDKKNLQKKKFLSFLSMLLKFFKKFFSRNLVFYLGFILMENIEEKNPFILAKILRLFGIIIKYFGLSFIVVPINSIIQTFLPLLKNRNEILILELVDVISLIFKKKIVSFPKKELMKICLSILDLIKNSKKNLKKKCLYCLISISNLSGARDLLNPIIFQLLIGRNKNKKFFFLSLLSIFRYCESAPILSSLFEIYQKKYEFIRPKIFFFRIFSYLLEFLPCKKIKSFTGILIYLIEDFLLENLDEMHPIILILITQIFRKTFSSIFAKKFKKVILLVLIDIFYKKKSLNRFLILFFKNLSLMPNQNYLSEYFILGSFHNLKKIREIFWNLREILFYLIIDSQTIRFCFSDRWISNLGYLF